MFGRNQQIGVTEDAAARLVEKEVFQLSILLNMARLLPQCRAGRRRNAADNDVADLPFAMTTHDMNDVFAAHDVCRE